MEAHPSKETADMEPLAKTLIDEVIEKEGGYVNHPSDRGGPTNWGITQRVAIRHGYIGSMKALPRDKAVEIYYEDYWKATGLHLIAPHSERIARELFDTGVNAGPSRAASFLQRSLNLLNQKGELYADITVDGLAGPATERALASYFRTRPRFTKGIKELVLLRALEGLQIAHYTKFAEKDPEQEDFYFGWIRTRIDLA